MSWKRIRTIGIVAIVCGLFSIAPVGEVDALPSADVERYYYSDATFTNEVGWYWLACTGDIVREGQTTPYYKQYRDPCNIGGSTCNYYVCSWCGTAPNQYLCGCQAVSSGC